MSKPMKVLVYLILIPPAFVALLWILFVGSAIGVGCSQACSTRPPARSVPRR